MSSSVAGLDFYIGLDPAERREWTLALARKLLIAAPPTEALARGTPDSTILPSVDRRSRRPRIGRRQTEVVQVRAVLADSVAVSTPLDPFLSDKALASYSGLGVRKLREHLEDAVRPLPCYRVGGKILVRRSEFDAWIAAFSQRGRRDVDAIVTDVLARLR